MQTCHCSRGSVACCRLPSAWRRWVVAAVAERPRVARVLENATEARVVGQAPAQLAPRRAHPRPRWQPQALGPEPFRRRHRRALVPERLEHEPDRRDDLLVAVERHLPVLVVVQPDRQWDAQLAARCLATLPADQARLDALQLVLADRTLDVQQQLVAAIARVVHAGLVENQRVGNARHLQQLAPVVVVAGQPRDLEAEHDADLPGGDARHQVAEAATVGGRGARLALVVVDHADATLAPAQRNRAAPQSVLAVRALGVRFDLLERRLAHVQAGLAGPDGGT